MWVLLPIYWNQREAWSQCQGSISMSLFETQFKPQIIQASSLRAGSVLEAVPIRRPPGRSFGPEVHWTGSAAWGLPSGPVPLPASPQPRRGDDVLTTSTALRPFLRLPTSFSSSARLWGDMEGGTGDEGGPRTGCAEPSGLGVSGPVPHPSLATNTWQTTALPVVCASIKQQGWDLSSLDPSRSEMSGF